MTRSYRIFAVFLGAGLCAEVIFRNPLACTVVSTLFMTLVAVGAVVAGRTPRKVRNGRALFFRRLIGWPMFLVEMALMIASCREMILLGEPQWIYIVAYFWVLAYLTWKVILFPESPSDDWPRGGGDEPEEPDPFPAPGISLLKPDFAFSRRDNGATVLRGLVNTSLQHSDKN